MNEYIERDKFLEAVGERNRNSCDGKLTYQQLKEMVENFPTADVMEVTRCKDCEHSYKDSVGLCCSYGACKDCLVPEYYFCFHGEKRRSDNA